MKSREGAEANMNVKKFDVLVLICQNANFGMPNKKQKLCEIQGKEVDPDPSQFFRNAVFTNFPKGAVHFFFHHTADSLYFFFFFFYFFLKAGVSFKISIE